MASRGTLITVGYPFYPIDDTVSYNFGRFDGSRWAFNVDTTDPLTASYNGLLPNRMPLNLLGSRHGGIKSGMYVGRGATVLGRRIGSGGRRRRRRTTVHKVRHHRRVRRHHGRGLYVGR